MAKSAACCIDMEQLALVLIKLNYKPFYQSSSF